MNKIIKMMVMLTITLVLSGCSSKGDLLQSNINPDTGDPYLNAHLPIYSCAGDHETVSKLLKLGLDHQIDAALQCAIESNNLETVKMLVDGGADINLETTEEVNLLFHAISSESYNLIDYLLAQGLDPYEEDAEGANILEYILKQTDFSERESMLAFLEVMTVLHEHGVELKDMKLKDWDDSFLSPLTYAIENSNPILTEALISLGFEMDLSAEYEKKVIEDIRYSMTRATQLIACIMYSKGNIPVYITTPGYNHGKIDMYLPHCADLLTKHYEAYQLNDEGATTPLINSRLSDEVIEAERVALEEAKREGEALERKIEAERIAREKRKAKEQEEEDVATNNYVHPMSAAEALEILENAYPDFTHFSGGQLSKEEYNESTGETEPAYLYVLTDNATGNPYVGWVFADGSYKLRASMWGD